MGFSAESLRNRSANLYPVLLGASLRDRATLPSPLRGLGPPGGYPSRLRSLRSLRAPLARRLSVLPPSPARPSTIHCTAMPQPHRADATRRAFRVPRPARPRQLRWRRALPRHFAHSAVAFPQTTRHARCRCRLRRTPATAQQLAFAPRTSSRRETGTRLAPAPVPLSSNRSPSPTMPTLMRRYGFSPRNNSRLLPFALTSFPFPSLYA